MAAAGLTDTIDNGVYFILFINIKFLLIIIILLERAKCINND